MIMYMIGTLLYLCLHKSNAVFLCIVIKKFNCDSLSMFYFMSSFFIARSGTCAVSIVLNTICGY